MIVVTVSIILATHIYLLCADISKLFDIFHELCNVAYKWYSVGLALGLHPDTLKKIEANDRDVDRRLHEVIDRWLRKLYDTTTYGQPSWERLVEAVAHPAGGSDRALADKIARKHNGKYKNTACCPFVYICFSPDSAQQNYHCLVFV